MYLFLVSLAVREFIRLTTISLYLLSPVSLVISSLSSYSWNYLFLMGRFPLTRKLLSLLLESTTLSLPGKKSAEARAIIRARHSRTVRISDSLIQSLYKVPR
jgi:hypothetical protein